MAGFIAGEASFYFGRCTTKNGYRTVQPGMKICLRDDDALILYELQRETGLGTVYANAHSRWSCGRDQMVWQVSSKAHCVTLVTLLDEYPIRAKKARDYAVWREMILAWHEVRSNPGRGHRHDWSEIDRLADELLRVRKHPLEAA